MAYSIEEEDKMMAMFESIASQPIEAQRPYNEVRNPKPMMESAVFEGTKVDFSSWTEDKAKVGKAKTASNPDLAKGNKTVKGVPEAAKGKLTETKAPTGYLLNDTTYLATIAADGTVTQTTLS